MPTLPGHLRSSTRPPWRVKPRAARAAPGLRPVLLCLALTGLACSSEHALRCGTPEVEAIGTCGADGTFAPLKQGDALAVTLQASGGHFLSVCARLTNYELAHGAKGEASVVLRAKGKVVGAAMTASVDFTTLEGFHQQSQEIRPLITWDLQELQGVPVEVEFKARDMCGQTARGAVGVVLKW